MPQVNPLYVEPFMVRNILNKHQYAALATKSRPRWEKGIRASIRVRYTNEEIGVGTVRLVYPVLIGPYGLAREEKCLVAWKEDDADCNLAHLAGFQVHKWQTVVNSYTMPITSSAAMVGYFHMAKIRLSGAIPKGYLVFWTDFCRAKSDKKERA